MANANEKRQRVWVEGTGVTFDISFLDRYYRDEIDVDQALSEWNELREEYRRKTGLTEVARETLIAMKECARRVFAQ